MPKFHLDCGDSNKGPIGLCGVVTADNAEHALAKFKALLPEEVDILKDCCDTGEEPRCSEDDLEYVSVYISAENIKITELDEEDED